MNEQRKQQDGAENPGTPRVRNANLQDSRENRSEGKSKTVQEKCPESCAVVKSLSHVWLFCNPVDCSPSLSMVFVCRLLCPWDWFSRQEYWSGLPFPSPEDLPDPGTEPLVSCISRWILYHWATKEALSFLYLQLKSLIKIQLWMYRTRKRSTSRLYIVTLLI